MSSVHLAQIRQHLINQYVRHLDASDIERHDAKAKENHFLTRSLSAFVIHALCGCDIPTACRSITDGADDNGIDSIYISKSTLTIYLVQSKWIHNGIGEPSLGDTTKFITGIKSLINCNFSEFNAKTQSIADDIKWVLSTPGSKLISCLAYTGNSDLATHSKRELDKLLKEVNDSSEYMTIIQINQKEIYRLLIEVTSGSPINTEVELRHWGRVDEPSEAYYGQMSGEKIHALWNEHGQRILAKNIRNSLGDTDVNNSIRDTILFSPQDFWYFNNGITLTAKRINKLLIGGVHRDVGKFFCEDISIVNGAQTISTIGRTNQSDKSQLESISVPARIISLEGREELFGEKITKSNNLQNKIEMSDFISLDENQIRLKQELSLEGINYSIKRDSDFKPTTTSFDVSECAIALVCASGDATLLSLIKREIGLLWSDTTRTPYTRIFNQSISSVYAFNCVYALRTSEEENEKILAQNKNNDFTQGALIHGNRVFSCLFIREIGKDKLQSPISVFKEHLQSLNRHEVAKKCMYSLTDAIISKHRSAVLLNLFKNQEKCGDIIYECTTPKDQKNLSNQSELHL